jgi:MIP family channel proteins
MNLQINIKVFLAEFIGTFALVLVGAGAAAMIKDVSLVGVALAHGLVMAVFYYAYGDLSGAHINPAITFGLAVNKVIQWTEAIYYWAAQFLGSMVAATVLYYIFNGAKSNLGATVLGKSVNPLQGVIIEAILTFFLVTAYFQTAVADKFKEYTGLAIGLTLTFCMLVGIPLTGAALNPARAFGPAIYTGTFNLFWIYLVGPLAGGIGAALLYRYMSVK